MKVKNISNKVIGIGNITVLPEETKEVPFAYEKNPNIPLYVNMGFLEIVDGDTSAAVANAAADSDEEKALAEEVQAEETNSKEDASESVTDAAEKMVELRKAQLGALKSMSDEDVGKLANEIGINPASCKDQADVKKKVAAALKKQIG